MKEDTLTVKELICFLNRYPEDIPVIVWDYEFDNPQPITEPELKIVDKVACLVLY